MYAYRGLQDFYGRLRLNHSVKGADDYHRAPFGQIRVR